MAKAAKIERTQKLFLKAMKEKFAEDPQATSTVYRARGSFPVPAQDGVRQGR